MVGVIHVHSEVICLNRGPSLFMQSVKHNSIQYHPTILTYSTVLTVGQSMIGKVLQLRK